MRRFFAVLASTLSLAAPALADGPVVLELYTSQGCSSCPPADAILHELAGRSDVIPLALHVDYWDYIGWVDEFARPEHTTRQQDYVRVAGGNTIYTPQMVIAGETHVIGAKAMEIGAAIEYQRNRTTGATVEIERRGDQLSITGETLNALPAGTFVQLVRYTPSATVDVRRGENAGRELTYTNIVQSWDIVGEWNGAEDLAINVAVSGSDPIAVIVQEPGPGSIIASAVLR